MSEQPDYWGKQNGGYRLPYDPRPALAAIDAGRDVAASWAELWDDLHHQGDVGEASYAAIVKLAGLVIDGKADDWNVYALAVTIEAARFQANNPPMPEWLEDDYAQAWQVLFSGALKVLPDASDENLISSVLATLAIQKKQPYLARLALLSESERSELLLEAGWG